MPLPASAQKRLSAALADRYRIQDMIGSGGMATVYVAEDLKHHRPVAVKILDPDLSESLGVKRFLREIETVANLTHPHVLPLFDSGEADGFLYFVMPYVKGESLRSRMERERQLPLDDAVQIVGEIADALSYAHGEGVVHRDVKPANILIESGHAVLADFGVAHAVSEAQSERMTGTRVSLGTPAYMSPEQAAGDAALDGRTDQYALGCVLFEMLSGEPPFTGSTPLAVLAKRVNEGLPSLATIRPDLPEGLIAAVERSLARTPSDRFETASDFRTAIKEGAGGGTVARTRGGGLRWSRWTLIPGLAIAALGIGLLALPPSRPLNRNELLVFPLEVSGQPLPEEQGRGEDNAYLIWNALAGRGSLGWLNALELADESQDVSRMNGRERRAFARAHGAGLYLHGRLLFSSDSAQAWLTLHEAEGDSVIARAHASAARAEAGLLGVRAVGELLLVLLPEETVDVSSIDGRDAEAVQTFVKAERHFHAGQFEAAFQAYSAAVAQDSGFALAAVKGAQAASWLHQVEDASQLIALALEHGGSLTPMQRDFARGWDAFFAAQADPAIHHFEQAIAIDGNWPEAWTGLGEVYTHLLPRKTPQDSLARDAFSRVYELTNHSAPALFHLAEFAVREGDLERATDLAREYRAKSPDTVGYATDKLALMLRCAERSASGINWRERVLEDVSGVLEAARSLGVAGRYPECALAGYQAVLAHDTSESRALRYAASVGLQSMLAATGRVDDLTTLLDTTTIYPASLKPHLILDALVGLPVDAQAEEEAASLRGRIPDLTDPTLWFLGVWDAHRGHVAEARHVLDLVADPSRGGDARRASLIAASLRAHIALADNDTVAAMRLFRELYPNVRRGSLYYAWESLGFERLTMARLLLARGRYSEAYHEASTIDSPGAANLVYPVFLPASLEIRREAARGLGDLVGVERMEARIRALGRRE